MVLAGLDAASAGMAAVWVVALDACTEIVPGPVPVSRRLHSAPAASALPQLWLSVKPVVVIWRALASTEPRFRSVMVGAVSIERASVAAAVVESLAR